MSYKHEYMEEDMYKEKFIWDLRRSLYSFRRSPFLIVILLQLSVLPLVASKGAGIVYLDMLPVLILITLTSSFMVSYIQGNQRILLFALILLTVGTMLQSIFRQEQYLKNPEAYTEKSLATSLQMQYVIAFLLALVMAFIYWNFRECSSIRIAEILSILSVIISTATLFLSTNVGNVKNWIQIGGVSFQITELTKFLYLFIAVALLGTMEIPNKARLTAFYLITFTEMGFLVLQSEFGTLLLILMVFFTFLFMFVPDLIVFIITFVSMAFLFLIATFTGIQLENLASEGSFLGNNPVAKVYIANFHKISNRFIYWLHPEKDSLGQGYQLLKAKESILSGGWFGTSSITDLPVKTSDLVFPALIQRCGMIFALLVFLIFILLWLEGMKVCVKKEDKYHRMLAMGLVSMFIDQTVIIIAGSTGLCPLTGITLPFISSGGSSLVISFMLVSVLLCISGNISWKGQRSDEIKFFEKSTNCAERVFDFGYRNVRSLIQKLGSSARTVRGGGSEKGGSETGGV